MTFKVSDLHWRSINNGFGLKMFFFAICILLCLHSTIAENRIVFEDETIERTEDQTDSSEAEPRYYNDRPSNHNRWTLISKTPVIPLNGDQNNPKRVQYYENPYPNQNGFNTIRKKYYITTIRKPVDNRFDDKPYIVKLKPESPVKYIANKISFGNNQDDLTTEKYQLNGFDDQSFISTLTTTEKPFIIFKPSNVKPDLAVSSQKSDSLIKPILETINKYITNSTVGSIEESKLKPLIYYVDDDRKAAQDYKGGNESSANSDNGGDRKPVVEGGNKKPKPDVGHFYDDVPLKSKFFEDLGCK